MGRRRSGLELIEWGTLTIVLGAMLALGAGVTGAAAAMVFAALGFVCVGFVLTLVGVTLERRRK